MSPRSATFGIRCAECDAPLIVVSNGRRLPQPALCPACGSAQRTVDRESFALVACLASARLEDVIDEITDGRHADAIIGLQALCHELDDVYDALSEPQP
jgi:hypothetical protein